MRKDMHSVNGLFIYYCFLNGLLIYCGFLIFLVFIWLLNNEPKSFASSFCLPNDDVKIRL